MISKENIELAHERIKPFVSRTPILTSEYLDNLTGCNLYFKCENLQKIGAFKARGAMNAALVLSEEQRRKGIATHSSGNHAQAIARAAKVLGIQSYIVMPKNAPMIKKQGVLELGGQITECDPNIQARETTLAEVIKKTGATEIHPFNNYDVITGQATTSKELIEDVTDLEIILAPVGGGGLLSGTVLGAKYFAPGISVIAAEPEGADDAYRSMQSGKIELSQSNSIADGLLTSLGEKNFNIIRDHVKEVITVSDKEIISAMKLVWERLKIIVEPSGAVPFAALLKFPEKFRDKKVGIIFSGGNVDLTRAFELFSQL